jgi:hypothetical protein
VLSNFLFVINQLLTKIIHLFYNPFYCFPGAAGDGFFVFLFYGGHNFGGAGFFQVNGSAESRAWDQFSIFKKAD